MSSVREGCFALTHVPAYPKDRLLKRRPPSLRQNSETGGSLRPSIDLAARNLQDQLQFSFFEQSGTI